MKNLIKLLTISVLVVFSSSAFADRTALTTITKMRPYSDGTYFVTVASGASLASGTCSTVFKVNNAAAGANAVIASLLTAYSLGQQIQIDFGNNSCATFGTDIVSVFMSAS